MTRKFTLNEVDSAGLRQRLVRHLDVLFVTKEINKYLAIGGSGTEIQLLEEHGASYYPALPNIKLAYQIWSVMKATDRLNVLCRFQQYVTNSTFQNRRAGNTLQFCAIFIHEFSAILAETQDWPD